jgi:hypothetical protein
MIYVIAIISAGLFILIGWVMYDIMRIVTEDNGFEVIEDEEPEMCCDEDCEHCPYKLIVPAPPLNNA